MKRGLRRDPGWILLPGYAEVQIQSNGSREAGEVNPSGTQVVEPISDLGNSTITAEKKLGRVVCRNAALAGHRPAHGQRRAEHPLAHDSADYVDWDRGAAVVLSELKPTQKTISLRLPAMMIAELKRLANKRDVPYQSLLKMFLAERIEEESRRSRAG